MSSTSRFAGGTRRATFGVLTALIIGVAAGASVGAPLPAAADASQADTGTTSACPTYNPPNALTLVAGTPQTARLGTPFEANLQVALAATNGCPITTPLAGIAVTFTAPAGGPSGTFAASGTNAVLVGTDPSGAAVASMFTANTLPGGYTVVASSSYGSVTFSLVNTASGIPATIAAGPPKSQAASVGARYAQPLQAEVVDAGGTPVQGASVTFVLGSTVGDAGATFDGGTLQVTEVTNSAGVAISPRFTANEVAGRFTASASTAGVVEPAGFSLDNLAARPPVVTRIGAPSRSATVDTRYRGTLQVKVTGAGGAPLAGAAVTFALGAAAGQGTAGATGAGASFVGGAAQATATTNAVGIATSPRFEANATAGKFTATATDPAAARAATFLLENHAGSAATLTVGVAATETAPVGSRFAIPLAVTVTDSHGNPVPAARVTFTAPAHGPSGRFARRGRRARVIRVETNAEGVAIAPAFTANRLPGGYIVKAAVKHASAAAFALVNAPPGQ